MCADALHLSAGKSRSLAFPAVSTPGAEPVQSSVMVDVMIIPPIDHGNSQRTYDARTLSGTSARSTLRGARPGRRVGGRDCRIAPLAQVEKRRRFPTCLIERGQQLVQERIIGSVLKPGTDFHRRPLAVRPLDRFAFLRRLPGRMIGLGVRREHVRSPVVRNASARIPRTSE